MTNETAINVTPGVAAAPAPDSEGESTNDILNGWETSYAGWVREAMGHIQKTEYAEALPYLALCLDTTNNNNFKCNTINSMKYEGLDQLSLLEKRCFIHMKLKMYDKIQDDARRIIAIKGRHTVAFKCLIAAFCKLDKLNSVREALKLWGKCSPNDLEMMTTRTRVLSMIKAVENGIDSSSVFSKVEEILGLKYDWLLGRKLVDSTWKHRPCPLVGSEELALCLQYRFGHCSLGEKCTDAHSEEELKEWRQRRALWNSAKDDASSTQTDAWTKYMNSISTEIDHLRNSTRPENWEVECGIHITSQAPLKCQITSLLKPHMFDFQVKTSHYRLAHISLFDDLHRHYFKISGVYCTPERETNLLELDLEDSSVASDQLLSLPTTLQPFEGSEYNYSIAINFETTVFGTFKQIIVFDFVKVRLDDGDKEKTSSPSIKAIRELNIDVVLSDDAESNHLKSTSFVNKVEDVDPHRQDQYNRKKTDVGIRSRSKVIEQSRTWNFGNSDIVDSFTGNKVCSTKVGFALISGRPNPSPEPDSTDQDILTKDNYKKKMRSFLTQEERARQEILSKYNILAQLSLAATYEMNSAGKEGTMQYAREGTMFARLALFRDVSEDTAVGRLILRNCNYVLISKNETIQAAEESGLKPKVYLCAVVEKTRNVMYLELGNAICQDLGLENNVVALFQVQFQLDRTTFIQQKTVIDLMKPNHLDLLFPNFPDDFQIPWNPVKQWNPIVENDEFRLNPKQKEALIAVTYEGVTPPILIIGPFGTGKTFTLAQCIKTIILQQKTRILVCTHSNSAADLCVKEYLDPLTSEVEVAKPLRIYFELRNLATVHPVVQKYCKIEKGRFVMPSKEEILAHRIIVVTLSTSFDLVNLDLEEDTFSHILLDEAAQAMESEAVTPLLAAGKNTKLVLAGDYMQLSPELFSSSQHFRVSLLERLHCVYTENNPCKIMLSENYRSHQAIIQFASDTFYKKNLKCGKLQPTHGTYYPLTFFCARGEDIQEKNSNSYHNMAEVYEVCEKVSELVSSWPESWGDWRDEGAIGVLTVYPDQVARIRSKLRSRGLSSVSVERVLNVQGKQFRAIFMSTVRTSKPWVHILPGNVSQEVDLGFLSNAKLLNTALTRAQSLVAVVGDPVSLCSLGKCRTLWKDFIEHCNENKSLYGISYSQLKQSILGTELRFTWGLNPLANDFEPAPPGSQNLRKADIEEGEFHCDADMEEDEFHCDADMNDDSNKTDEEILLPGLSKVEVTSFKTPESPEEALASDFKQQPEVNKNQDSDPELAHLKPASDFWKRSRKKVIQDQTVKETSAPVHKPEVQTAPYSWNKPGQSTPFGALPAQNRPQYMQAQYIPHPPYYEPYQMPPPPGPPPMFHTPYPPSAYFINPPYQPPSIPNWVYQSGGHGTIPFRGNMELTPAQLSGIPLQCGYQLQRFPPIPHDPRYQPFQRNGPSTFGPNTGYSANFPPLQLQANTSAPFPSSPFTQGELVAIKRLLEHHIPDPGRDNLPHNGIQPDFENLHQTLSSVGCTTENLLTHSMPHRHATVPSHATLRQVHPRMPQTGPINSNSYRLGQAGSQMVPVRFAPPLSPRSRASNTSITRTPPERERRTTPVLSPANLVNQQQTVLNGPSSSRSYANVARTQHHNLNSENNMHASSGATREYVVGASGLMAPKSSVSISTNNAKPAITPLMSVPIPTKFDSQSTSKSTPKQSNNKTTHSGKKSHKKK